jgi:hypothetical protein
MIHCEAQAKVATPTKRISKKVFIVFELLVKEINLKEDDLHFERELVWLKCRRMKE